MDIVRRQHAIDLLTRTENQQSDFCPEHTVGETRFLSDSLLARVRVGSCLSAFRRSARGVLRGAGRLREKSASRLARDGWRLSGPAVCSQGQSCEPCSLACLVATTGVVDY